MPRQNSCPIAANTKATKVNMISEVTLSAAGVRRSIVASATSAHAVGKPKMRAAPATVPRRQASIGPIPASSTSSRASGVVIRSKNGGPTLSFVPVIASEISGKYVPQAMTTHSATSTRLLRRKNASRDISESSLASDLRSLARLTMSAMLPTAAIPMKIRNGVPSVDAPNAWIELSTPLRTRNVPSSESTNVPAISDTFHIFSIPRFSCTITE